MFTGITQGIGILQYLDRQPHMAHIGVALPDNLSTGIMQGASISLNGVCLTVVKQSGSVVYFDVIEETLLRTTLSGVTVGYPFNVERALKFGDELGGHILSGHVMGTALVQRVEERDGQQKVIHLQCSPTWMDYILPKGFIALNGASLTVVETTCDGFSVHLIPETLKVTNLGHLKEGDKVNVEIDHQTQTIVATVQEYLKRMKL